MDDDLLIRPADAADAEAIAEVHIASWRGAYTGVVAEEYLDSLDQDTRAAEWRTNLATPGMRSWVAREEDRVRGFITLGPSRDVDAGLGALEIYAIYLEPAAWGSGIARELLRTVTGEVPPSTPLSLWVLADNDRARHFYRRHGFVTDGIDRIDEIGGVGYRQVRYVRD